MTSPPSRKKPSTKDPLREASDTRSLERDEIRALEEIHGLLLESQVVVSVAHELDHDGRWPDRVGVLLRSADELVNEAHESTRKLVRAVYRRLRRESGKSR